MTELGYRETAAQAMAAGWNPTQAYDEQGRPLWSIPGRDGLVPLERYLHERELRQAA